MTEHIATISKEFEFSASHRLEGLADDHPCSRLHGHNYTIKVAITGHTDEVGFVIDYRALGFVKQMLDSRFDHRHLNDVLPGENPTAENIAGFLLESVIEGLDGPENVGHVAVSVSETRKTWATVGRYLQPAAR